MVCVAVPSDSLPQMPHKESRDVPQLNKRDNSSPRARTKSARSLDALILALPFLGLLVPAVYARATPYLFGWPFFYWYQFAWIPLSAACTGAVYMRARSANR